MAVSTFLAIVGLLQNHAAADMYSSAWKQIRSSLITVEGTSGPVGAAVLIDRKGLFLAHANAIPNSKIVAKTYDGKSIPLAVRSVDETTNLVLLEAGWWRDKTATPADVSQIRDYSGQTVLACLPAGPVVGQFVSADRVGVLKPSLRYAPLSEIRFETQDNRVAGAFVFSKDGKLIGVMNATLDPVNGTKKSISTPDAPQRVGEATQDPNPDFGPRGLTVGYALGVEILKRVVDGFKSQSRTVSHPTIGCFFRDASGRGAYIEALLPDSPAARGGLKISDIVIEANGQPIRSHVDFAVFLFKQSVNGVAKLKVKRASQEVDLIVTIGQQDAKSAQSSNSDF